MEEEEEREEITMEELYEGLKAVATIACFEKEFGPMLHPLRIFKFRRWIKDFEAFLKGVECGEMIIQKMTPKSVQKAEKRRTIEVMEGDEERVSN